MWRLPLLALPMQNTVLSHRHLPAAQADDWHWPEYSAEFVGTAWLVFIGLSAVVFNMARECRAHG